MRLTLTKQEKEKIAKIADLYHLKFATFIKKIIVDELDSLDMQNPEGVLLRFRKEEDPLKGENIIFTVLNLDEKVHKRLEIYADKAEISIIRFIRYLVIPYIDFYMGGQISE